MKSQPLLFTTCAGFERIPPLYAMHEQDHHYTTSAVEVNAATSQDSYRFEGAAAYIYEAKTEEDKSNKTVSVIGPGIPGLVPLYRLYFGGKRVDHFFTTNKQEADTAVNDGAVYEGLAGYVATQPLHFQPKWRVCQKCGVLILTPNTVSCAAGGKHSYSAFTNPEYTLSLGTLPPTNKEQNGWSKCQKCQSLWYSGNAKVGGVCPAGGKHEKTDSTNYTLAHDIKATQGTNGWKYCKKCAGLWFGITANVCPAGGGHDGANSFDYRLVYARSIFGDFVPLYRLYDAGEDDHFYTTSTNERNDAAGSGYLNEGIACYVIPVVKQPALTDKLGLYAPVPLWRVYQESSSGGGGGFSLADFIGIVAKVGVIIAGALFFGSGGKKCAQRKDDGSVVFYYCEDGPPPN